MGLDFGLESTTVCLKRKFRWLFIVPSVSAEGISSLPPSRGARPGISFKEIQVEHLNETIFYPGKPDWKPVELVLYDLKKNSHPVFRWLQNIYNPSDGQFATPLENGFIKSKAYLELYDGCGTVLEKWVFENIWPNSIDFGELDMANSEIVTCSLTLRYARAYLQGQ